MKKIKSILIATIAIIAMVVSCHKDEIEEIQFKVYTQYLYFKSIQSAESVKIQADQKPIAVTPQWISASITKETDKEAIWTMTIICLENNTDSERKGVITVSCNNNSAEIEVSQQKGKRNNEEEDDKKEDEQNKPTTQDTPESILLAVQDTYKVKSWSETDSSITVIFHEPHPVELVKDYPEGIQNVTVAKTDVKKFSASDDCLEFVFMSEKTATISLYKAPQDTPESMLIAVQSSYTLYSVEETDDEITVIFHEPKPVTLNQEYPEGIKSITISKENLESFVDKNKCVEFTFTSGNSAIIQAADIPTTVTFNKELIELQCADPEKYEHNSTSVGFTLTCCRPEKVKVEAIDMSGCPIVYPDGHQEMDYHIETEVTMHEGNTSGTIIMTADCNTNYTDKIKVTINNGIKIADFYIDYKTIRTIYGLTEEQLRTGLTAFYNACNGPAWEKQKNWLTDAPLNEWEGIGYAPYTPSDGSTNGFSVMLFSIEFYDNNIKGKIPDEFWECCKYAFYIKLSDTDLSESTMPEKAWGKYLSTVWLDETGIKANISHSKTNLYDVLMLECKLEPLTSEFFNSSYPKLRRLVLEFENPSPLPANIGNLSEGSPYLKVLTLINLQGECPESVFNIAQLKELWLIGRLIGNIPPSVSQMKDITQMVLGLYSTSGKIPNELGNCKKLWLIDIGDCITEYPEAIRYIPAGWNMRGGLNTTLWEYKQYTMEGEYYELPMPEWFAIRYGSTKWTNQTKPEPVWPNADDLEHPADEIFWVDGQWQHRPDMKYTEENEDDGLSNII